MYYASTVRVETHPFPEFRGAAQSLERAAAQFGIGSVRDRKNGLLDGDVVE